MVKIGLLSDTHSWLDPQLFDYFKEVDEIWHAGDIGSIEILDTLKKFKPLRAVYGNIDGSEFRKELKLDSFFTIENMHVWMTHIGGYPGRYVGRVKNILQSTRPHLFVCGHSHICKVVRDKKRSMLCLNPGAAGIHGFHKVRTALRFEIEGNSCKNMEVIELGLRGKIDT